MRGWTSRDYRGELMASIGYLESLLNTLPAAVKTPLVAFTREAFKTLQFGAPSTEAVAATNLHGHLVPVTTAGVSGQEVAVAHKLGRVPRMLLNFVSLDTVNATLVPLTVTKAADATYLYLSSTVTGASTHVYVE